VDSEEELVAGENNYIEIDCLPLDPLPHEQRSIEEAKAAEEEALAENELAPQPDVDSNFAENARGSLLVGAAEELKKEKLDEIGGNGAEPAAAEEEKKQEEKYSGGEDKL